MADLKRAALKTQAFIHGYHDNLAGLAALEMLWRDKRWSHRKHLTIAYAAGVIAKRRGERCPCPVCFIARGGLR